MLCQRCKERGKRRDACTGYRFCRDCIGVVKGEIAQAGHLEPRPLPSRSIPDGPREIDPLARAYDVDVTEAERLEDGFDLIGMAERDDPYEEG